MTNSEALNTAIQRAGGLLKFARAMGVSHQAVSQWRKKCYVPINQVWRIERMYSVPAEHLMAPILAAEYTNDGAGDLV